MMQGKLQYIYAISVGMIFGTLKTLTTTLNKRDNAEMYDNFYSPNLVFPSEDEIEAYGKLAVEKKQYE